MRLDNGILSVEISEHGAEPVSIEKFGRQYLWNADPAFWNRHAPILFPAVGRMKDDGFTYEGRRFPMKQHGFARDCSFAPTGNSGELRLAERPSADVYPFDFELTARYELEGNRLVAKWKVVNTGAGEMFFQIGAHPGFLLPDYDANDPVHGYLRFYDREGRETMPLVVSELEDGLRVTLNEPKTYLGEGAYPITDATFRNNALLFEGGQVAVVDLLDKHGAPVLRVDCPQAEAFGIWAPFKPGCPFVCLEPWCGICDPSDFHGTLSERKYIHRLRAGEEFGFEYGITV